MADTTCCPKDHAPNDPDCLFFHSRHLHERGLSVLRLSLAVLVVGCLGVAARTAAQKPGSDKQAMNITTAEEWGKLVLKGIDTEFPTKLSLMYTNESQIGRPQDHFPAFFGCFDWHSSVHGHWVLVRLLKQYPDMQNASHIRKAVANHFTAPKLAQEAGFFAKDEQKSFERMYGWAWLLRLVTELASWEDHDAKVWRQNLAPLEKVLVRRIENYLPRLSYPIRIGQHTDTAFALGQILDYSIAMDNKPLETLVKRRANEFYGADVAYPVHYEPSGHDFFSSCWNEADLMRRVLPQEKFEPWLRKFLPMLAPQLADGTISPVVVSDVTDPKIVHLAGLNLNRAWCLQSVAAALAPKHPLTKPLQTSAQNHLKAGLEYINSGHYEGDHWLATFGLYAVERIAVVN